MKQDISADFAFVAERLASTSNSNFMSTLLEIENRSQ